MKTFNCQQGSIEWLRLHLGIPTASVFSQIMTSAFKPRDGEMRKTCLYKKLAERLTGKPLPGFSVYATEQGQLLETEAYDFFEFDTGHQLSTIGFILADDERCGCSPDALIGENSGLEIKCPNAETHLRYLDAGKLPADYAAQVHGSMFVTGRQEWHFLSYFRGLKPFHIRVERDEKIIQQIGECLANFHADFDAMLKRFE